MLNYTPPPPPTLPQAVKTVQDFLDAQDHAGFTEMEAWRRVVKELNKIPAAQEALDTASVPLGMSIMRFWDAKILEVRRILSGGD